MAAFLRAVRATREDSTVRFFPRTGDLTYRRTSHLAEWQGTGEWRFPPFQVRRAMDYGQPLHASFSINPHGQPIALLYQQVILRGSRWRRVRGDRFVPPGAPASSATYVQWGREGGEWVVVEFGDELFAPPFPDWCC